MPLYPVQKAIGGQQALLDEYLPNAERNVFGGKVTLRDMLDFVRGKTAEEQVAGFAGPAINPALPLAVGLPIGYHGTLSSKWFMKETPKESFEMLDRMIGPHFAKDPKVANKFAEGLYRTNPSHLYDEFGNPSIWGKPQIPQGGNVRKAFIPDELYEVPQPKYPSGNIMSDQYAIGSDIARTVFPERKDLFINWFTRARNSTEKVAEDVWKKIKHGESVKIGDTTYNSVGDIVAEYDSGLHMLSENLRPEVIQHYKDIMRKKGYKGIQYKNTAPSEVLEGEGRETYIPFNIEDIEPKW